MAQWDPKNSENDRRVFYEVTGLRLVPEEFQDDHSSDDDVTLKQLLQMQYQTNGIERGGPSSSRVIDLEEFDRITANLLQEQNYSLNYNNSWRDRVWDERNRLSIEKERR